MQIRDILNELDSILENPEVGDHFELELDDTLIESVVVDLLDDGVVIHIDETAEQLLQSMGYQLEEQELDIQRIEAAQEEMLARNPQYAKEHAALGIAKVKGMFGASAETNRRWTVKTAELLKKYGALKEAEYQGRKVPLGKPMKGDVKKSKVYVKGPKGNVVKVNFGDKKMKIKKSIPGRRKSFRARHNCANPGPRWKARYWSCRAW